MGLRIPVRKTVFELYEQGQYLVRVTNIVPTENPPTDERGQPLDYWTFVFKFVEGDYEGKIISANAHALISFKSKLNKWLGAFGINALEEYADKDFDSDDVKGKYVNVIIEHNVGKLKSGEDATFHNVTSLLPVTARDKERIASIEVAEKAAPAKTEKPATSVKTEKPAAVKEEKAAPATEEKPAAKKTVAAKKTINTDNLPF